ncbi:hypothetical protein [Vacuolonema iberomarrocanum]|uniref:hypothetical protein n=1 Tax=Vacuolonema iberomarrocanum TaxID=3454632 RepID=UPI001A0DF369|nr:hypothetical protein [filamentous cyanobacterium LEGE 07170]
MHEDQGCFEQLRQSLVEQYKPVGVLEENLVLKIAVCLVKQYRVWAAESAVQNASLLPAPAPLPTAPPQQLTTDQVKERNVLRSFQYELNSQQTNRDDYYAALRERSPEDWADLRDEAEGEGWLDTFPVIWEEELGCLAEDLTSRLPVFLRDYPTQLLPEALPVHPNSTFSFWRPTEQELNDYLTLHAATLRRLTEANHPYARTYNLYRTASNFSRIWSKEGEHEFKSFWQRSPGAKLEGSAEEDAWNIIARWNTSIPRWLRYDADKFYTDYAATVQSVQAALKQYDNLEAAYTQAATQQTEIEAQRAELMKQTLPESIERVCRYETHNNNQLQQTLNQLFELQKHRKSHVDL